MSDLSELPTQDTQRDVDAFAPGYRPVDNCEWSLRYAGWRVVAAAFVGIMVSFAAVVPFTFSLFLEPLHAEFGWGREAISLAFAIAALTVAGCSPILGFLLDRHPPRTILLPCIVVFSLVLCSLAQLQGDLRRFYFSFFLLGVVGNGTAQLAYSRAVSTWFRARRGLAFACMFTGSGMGSILLPMLVQHAMALYGWRSAYFALGIVAAAGLPLTALFVRENPAFRKAETEPPLDGMRVRDALASRVFWILIVSILLSAFSLNGAIAHLAAILVSRHVAGQAAALSLSLLGASAIVARLFTGSLLDRFFAPHIAVVMQLMPCCGLAVLALAHSGGTGAIAAILLGIGMGSETDITPYLISRYCGLRQFSALYGLSWTAYAIGGAMGPVVVGSGFDRTGSYQSFSLLLLAVPCLLGAVLNLLLPAYRDAAASDRSLLAVPTE